MVESRNPSRKELRSDYSLLNSSDLRVEVALKLSTVNCQRRGRARTIHRPYNCQLSTVNCQLSTVNCQLSTVNCQLSTVNCQLSTVNCQL
ncbi:hypothetical protein [Microcoleus sp. CAWBG50]|uniref:hypothetical protein n=1 Tax=Microcoleus sp. CAWBG50 TaxID=2841646 RepID=UPI0025D3D245|nr:hypothetical protein [Microcoleus sp. CAWBG50]